MYRILQGMSKEEKSCLENNSSNSFFVVRRRHHRSHNPSWSYAVTLLSLL